MPSSQRILLVEDDPEQALLFTRVLTLQGHAVVTVASAPDALVQLTASPFTLLLSDWDLPGMAGDRLIAIARDRHPELKTILFSNHAHVDQAGLECGADAWFRKIEGIAALRRTIAAVLPAPADE